MWTRAVPVILVLIWSLALIGGHGVNGWLHLLLPLALLFFLWDALRGQTE